MITIALTAGDIVRLTIAITVVCLLALSTFIR